MKTVIQQLGGLVLLVVMAIVFAVWWTVGKPIVIKKSNVKIGELRWFKFTHIQPKE